MKKHASTLIAALLCMLVLLPIAVIALVPWTISATVRLIAQRIERNPAPWTDLMAYDPVLGWRPKPRLNLHYLAERDDVYNIETDQEGWPGADSLEDCDIVALGDSFAFGYGIDTRRSFARRARAVRVKAVGAPGYSMVQATRVLEQLGPRLAGKKVVWLIYLENDLQDNLAPNLRQYRAPYLRQRSNDGHWEIACDHVAERVWDCSATNSYRFGVLAHLCAPSPIADRAYAAVEWLLARAAQLCRQAGAELIVVTIPHRILLRHDGHAQLAAMLPDPDAFDPALPDRQFANICARLRIPFHAGRDVFRFEHYKAVEGVHWNARGHLQMARLLERIHKGIGDASPASAYPTAREPAVS